MSDVEDLLPPDRDRLLQSQPLPDGSFQEDELLEIQQTAEEVALARRRANWADSAWGSIEFGPANERELSLVGWALFGARAVKFNWYPEKGDDGELDALHFVVTFTFSEKDERQYARFSHRLSGEQLADIKTHGGLSNVRRPQAWLVREMAIHVIETTNKARQEQVGDAIIKAVEDHGSIREIQRIGHQVKEHGWEALRRDG